MPKPIIGLIGGMGSGKSTVAAEFVRRGARIVSGDQAGHEALRQPEIREELVRRWGVDILTPLGEIDRKKVGARVFADPEERRALEALVFPWIEGHFKKEVAAANADPSVAFVLLDAAIMLEGGWNNVCDRLVYVDAPREVRLQRLASQRGWDAKEVEARERAQMPLEEKRRRADAVLDNGGAADAVGPQIDNLLRHWKINYRPGSEEMR